MKPISLVFYTSLAILLSITAAGAYFHAPTEPSVEYTMPSWVPTGFLNRTTTPTQWGDLTRFNITVECDLSGGVAKAPIISYTDVPMTEGKLRTIASDIFGMDAPILDDHPLSDISLRQGQRGIRDVSGGIWYIDSPGWEYATLEEWNQTEVRRIADKMINALEPYWVLPTDAVRRASFIGPTAWHQSDKYITLFSVRHIWSVEGIDIMGYGCVVSVSHNGVVTDARYVKPLVSIVGHQSVTVTPEKALANFIEGKSINSVIGAPRVRCDIPENATVAITGIHLVYYPLKSPEGEVVPVLVYQIGFDVISEYGRETNPAYEYEYAN